jgi:hypothetical protein
MIERTASRLGRNDDEPNIALAQELASKKDAKGVAEIAAGIEGKDASTASDCIKVLYEVGYREPELIAQYAPVFVSLLGSKSNRLVWGAAIALAQVAPLRAEYLFGELDAILAAFERGSVITVDNCVSILAGIAAATSTYQKKIAPLILDHLRACRPKEVPQHAQRATVCMTGPYAARFEAVLEERYPELTMAQRKRIDKLLRKERA